MVAKSAEWFTLEVVLAERGMATLRDMLSRPMRDLRISLTDRCNFRCTYCMPKEVFGAGYAFLSPEAVLTFDEIVRLTAIFARLGVRKIRLTGGEPLLRGGIETLISQLRRIDGIEEIALTTNGSRLTESIARRLKSAGLHRVTISLDALDDEIFQAMNDVGFSVAKVLDGIRAVIAADLAPVKVNMVVRRGFNDSQVLPMAEYFRGSGCILRFIEFMDVGNTNQWKLDEVVPSVNLVRMIDERWPLEPVQRHYPGEVATRYRYVDGQGEVGFISSVTQAFCAGCTRSRLSAEGQLFTCLFASSGFDLRELMRGGATDEVLEAAIRDLWHRRDDRYSESRSGQGSHLSRTDKRKVEMSRIGG